MYKYLIMLIFCVITQRLNGKSLFDYNINPEYDLVADASSSYSNFWPSSEFYVSPQIRYKHQTKGRGHGRGNGKRKLPPHAFGLSDGYHYPDSSEEFSGEIFHSAHPHHPHGIPPGQAKKQGYPHGHPPGSYHDHPHGSPYSPPHEPPRRFPPPPVYDKDFINPWILPATTPKRFIVQQPPLTTPRPFIVQQPPLTTPAVYVAPKLTTKRPTVLTTPSSVQASSTAADDKLIYDIDVRFGRD
ncbi:pollen-specific leucine-rich repeat extensin-like protein 3 [Lucilia cuprina]|uniref:pollen-specific leucine-rich repeat extensin-like protein 3 n=1 Tax=Lucilia cuprina TaxID=7375 RepID=UPI001F06B97A|nr:pollen-specific leucine-rich repeat extensin-like protein 3 [Lucilia cuprina]